MNYFSKATHTHTYIHLHIYVYIKRVNLYYIYWQNSITSAGKAHAARKDILNSREKSEIERI